MKGSIEIDQINDELPSDKTGFSFTLTAKKASNKKGKSKKKKTNDCFMISSKLMAVWNSSVDPHEIGEINAELLSLLDKPPKEKPKIILHLLAFAIVNGQPMELLGPIYKAIEVVGYHSLLDEILQTKVGICDESGVAVRDLYILEHLQANYSVQFRDDSYGPSLLWKRVALKISGMNQDKIPDFPNFAVTVLGKLSPLKLPSKNEVESPLKADNSLSFSEDNWEEEETQVLFLLENFEDVCAQMNNLCDGLLRETENLFENEIPQIVQKMEHSVERQSTALNPKMEELRTSGSLATTEWSKKCDNQ